LYTLFWNTDDNNKFNSIKIVTPITEVKLTIFPFILTVLDPITLPNLLYHIF
mgnify:CR=1